MNGNKNTEQDPVSKRWLDCQGDYAMQCMSTLAIITGWYSGVPCDYTFGQLGYRDEEPQNNVPDVFDSPPAVFFHNAARESLFAIDQPIGFTAVSQAVRNRNSVQKKLGPLRDYATPIKSVSYSLNGTGSILLQPVDGEFNDPVEEFEIRLTFLLPGESEVAVTGTNAYAAKSEPVLKEVYYFGLDFWGFRIEHKNEGIGIAWFMRGKTFDADLKLIRIDHGTEPAAVDTVAWPDDLQPVAPPQRGLTPYYFLDTDVVPGTEYFYTVEGTFDVLYRDEMVQVTSESAEIRATAAIPSNTILSLPVPNPFYPSRSDTELLVSVIIPGAPTVPLFSSVGGPNPAAGQGGDAVIEPIALTVGVFDVAGRRIRDLFNDGVLSEVVNVTWDGRNRSGNLVPSGVYFIKAQVGEVSDSKKVLVLR
jgi:hypothetical protein